MSTFDHDCADSIESRPVASVDSGNDSVWSRFRQAWQDRSEKRFHKKRDNTNLDFLPAALEILERPPSPAGRWLGYALIALFVVFIVWASVGEVDVVASAEGKIIPSARIKQIQPMQVGVIKNLFVVEGQRVKKGDALIELDQTLTGADKLSIGQEYDYLESSLRREKSLSRLFEIEDQGEIVDSINSDKYFEGFYDSPAADTVSQQTINDKKAASQQRMAKQKWLEYSTQQAIVNDRLNSRRAELASISANVGKFQSTIPLITKRVEALSILNDEGIIAEARLLELQEALVTQQQNLISEQARRMQVQAAISEATQNRIALENDARKSNSEAIADLEQRLGTLRQELLKADELYAKQILYSPVNGYVQELAVHTIGGVVQAAQSLMHIVPDESFLEVEATLENKDIGFIHRGQRAEIKVHTFPFTKYGVVDAEVTDITADAIESEQQGLVYKVRFKMDTTRLRVDKQWVNLLPGMAVSAEVKTGKRKLIEFFLSPLLRYRDESVRER